MQEIWQNYAVWSPFAGTTFEALERAAIEVETTGWRIERIELAPLQWLYLAQEVWPAGYGSVYGDGLMRLRGVPFVTDAKRGRLILREESRVIA